jgi:hypothetical protein
LCFFGFDISLASVFGRTTTVVLPFLIGLFWVVFFGLAFNLFAG